MFEKKPDEFDQEKMIQGLMRKRGKTKTEILAMLRKEIPREPYFQTKIKQGIKKRYPNAFVRKINQGHYSEGGIPDVLVVIDGHYFGFEVKRPIVGIPSDLQKATIRQIMRAGGTACFVCWPEDAIAEIERWRCEKTGEI